MVERVEGVVTIRLVSWVGSRLGFWYNLVKVSFVMVS